MKTVLSILLATVLFNKTVAQKLPNTQQSSIRAPATVQIDGKASEWGNGFQAYNAPTELFYTMANDNKKLYLVVQTNVQNVLNRITSGGIKLIVQKSGAKNDDGAATVKFPYDPDSKRLTFALTRPGETQPMPLTDVQADSLLKLNNQKLAKYVKWIYTQNIAGVDQLLPLYNDKGIEGAVAFDNKRVYTFELAVDLKLLGLSADNASKFAYHLIVNGEPNKYSVENMGILPKDNSPEELARVQAVNDEFHKRAIPRTGTTDFWCEYTLAK